MLPFDLYPGRGRELLGITDVPPSPITGNIGASPITGAAIHVSCAEVTGTISAVNAAGPLTAVELGMESTSLASSSM